MLRTKLRISGVALPLPQKQHVNPPIPLFKIPPTQWPIVLQRVAQGESLRQIARSYHTSYEAVRRVLNAARKDLLASQGKPDALHPEDAEESSKE
ncbi:MAG TPA: helix-turn-helix domain-containing protein [Ktedonobacterales bacterium]|nr:helix-turn-helix domain-containing protein [Ktedonobacterales bacterium]